jgi:hypothetical protein
MQAELLRHRPEVPPRWGREEILKTVLSGYSLYRVWKS